MKIIYYCFAGAHASVVAAAIHCGRLPAERVPTSEEFARLPYYDRTPPELVGRPYFMGPDEFGNSIYFIGFWSQRRQLADALTTFLASGGIPRSEYILQDAFPLINFSTKLGGLLSKRYRLTGFGRRITIWGLQRQYPQFVALVTDLKQRLASGFCGGTAGSAGNQGEKRNT